tara:strand:+ start:2894 stop:4147 length:1254 start_codon:yes stop_codon:yes gene_type:complete
VNKTSNLKGWFIFAIAAAFYAYEFFLRVTPAAMQSQIMSNFGISAKSFGFLMSSYFYAYTPLQLFVGSIMDLYGTKNTLVVAVLACLVGAIIFSQTDYFTIAILSYALVGFGSAFAFVGVLKISSIWLPANYLAIATGIATSMGMLGAISGEFILDAAIQVYGQHQTLTAYSLIGLLLLGAVVFIVDDQPHRRSISKRAPVKFKTLIRDILKIRHSSQFWINGIIGSLLFMPTNVFASMWAVMFFKQTYYFPSSHANAISSMLFAGWAIGAPIWGWLSSRQFRAVTMLRYCALISSVLLWLIIYHKTHDITMIYIIMFLVGMFSSVQVLVFPIATSFFDKKLIGTAISLTNMLVMLNTFISPLVGTILDLSWDGATIGNERIFSAHGFEQALLILPLGLFISFILTYFLKENSLLNQ